jgi:hypothetical protein
MKKYSAKRLQYAVAGRRYTQNVELGKKNSIIRNIEIIVACVVAFMAGTGMYELFK